MQKNISRKYFIYLFSTNIKNTKSIIKNLVYIDKIISCKTRKQVTLKQLMSNHEGYGA